MMWKGCYQIALLLGLSFAIFSSAHAQEPPRPDTVDVVPPDTLNGEAPDEPEEPLEEIDFGELASPTIPLLGHPLDDVRPTLRPVEDVTELLRNEPGSFRHDLGEIGWPHGWSPLGLHPNRQDLLLNRRSYEDLLTGRPFYELLPIDIIGPLYARSSPEGAPVGVSTRFPDFDQAEPLTEIRYRRASVELSGPMQGVNVFHTQRRRADFGQPGIVNIMASYAGRASDNTYPTSELSTERNLLGRMRYRNADYSLEVRNHHVRRRTGARGSVIPARGNLESIYNVNLASINPILSGAHRRVVRNDLSLTGQLSAGNTERPFISTQIYWTRQFNRYDNQPDLLDVVSDRVGVDALIPLHFDAHHLALEAKGYADTRARRSREHGWQSNIHVGLRDSVVLGNVKVESSAYMHALGHDLHPTGQIEIGTQTGPFVVGAQLQRGIQKIGWLERVGMEPFVTVNHDRAADIVSLAAVRAGFQIGTFELDLKVFAHQTEHATELIMGDGPQSAQVVESDAPLRRAGVISALYWRRHSPAGPYLTGHLTGSAFPDHPDRSLPERAYFAIPEIHGIARIGWRAVLFQGDLDFDAYVQGHMWSTMRGRTIHPPSGLLALPPTEGNAAAIVPSDGMIDIQAEAKIRDATLFLAYNNALSGTALQPGTFNSPIFPLPAQQFRFGVHWPILY